MIGELVGNYRIIGKLGEGGMGVVYAAEHRLIGRKAAIKMLLPEVSSNREVVWRFFNEARATTLVRHGGIVDVFDYGVHATGQAFIVMEHLEGETLKARIRREGALPVGALIEITRQTALALAAAHGAGIVHRDLKPDNLFLVPTSELPGGRRVKVLDFGVAKLAGRPTTDADRTRTNALLGTPRYMSPEQCRGAGLVDHRSDLYSLGCIMFEMACGHPPFEADGPGELIAAHLYAQPPDIEKEAPALPEMVARVIRRAMAKAPAERPQSMGELLVELGVPLDMTPPPPRQEVELGPAPMPELEAPPSSGTLTGSAAELVGRPRVSRRVLLVGAAALVAAGAIGAGAWLGRTRRAETAATGVSVKAGANVDAGVRANANANENADAGANANPHANANASADAGAKPDMTAAGSQSKPPVRVRRNSGGTVGDGVYDPFKGGR